MANDLEFLKVQLARQQELAQPPLLATLTASALMLARVEAPFR